MAEPLPVPTIENSAPSSAHTTSSGVVVPDTIEPEAARDDSSETDVHAAPAPSPGLRVPSPRGSVGVPEVPPKRPERQSTWEKQNAASTSNPRLDTDSLVVVDVTSSAGQSSTNLNDIADVGDEDKGHQLAREFLAGDATHVPPDKVAMFLGGPRPVNKAALRHYMQHFDMRGLKLDQAFRDLCAKLHLKAESQEIDRIIEGFSARFYDCNPNTVYGTPGVVHTVTGAMLMLNTDLHIADIQKHMSRQDFVRNSMRAIQESMPDRESTPDLVNDSGSLRNIDSLSASHSTTSVRLRNAAGTPRNTSGNLISPTSDLASTSTQDLRSRGASSTTVNSFTYTKAWETEAETALKEIYSNVRNERILLPIASMGDPNHSSSTLGGLRVGSRGGINALMRPNTKNAPYNAMFNSQGDGSLSPTPSYANSIGDLALPPSNPIGFAGNLSHTVIREQEDEIHSIRSGETGSTVEELNDDELALLGAPWAKEGLLQRKIQVEAHGRKPQKKDWKQYFVVIQKGDLSMFVFGSGGGSSMGGGTVGGGNWMSSANRHGEYSLMHAMAMALPKPGYSASRPYCFTVTFPSGEISVFQAGTEELVLEWVATCNYWAARRSRQPLVGGVSNMEYGWTRALNQLDDNGQHHEPHREQREPQRMGLGARARLGAISRVRGASSSGNDRVQMDKIHINDWKPPPHATMPSTLDDEAQLESLCAYVQSLKEELDQHKTIEEPMSRLQYTPGSKNAMRARENWTAKSRYIHSEIFKYETYVEALRNAMNQRVQRQGERKVERSLARSAPSIRREAPRKLNGGGGASLVGMVPAAHDLEGDAYVRRSEDGRQTPTSQAQAV
ncbi:SEC7-like protein [Cutaneotrichosporon oleaginosum]|uniref:SEC7-like protein n=1 Tax=Cutaneotrichosporon oleaginosum TaxID=879819 RepID=A0A0J0XPP9_9TREE|nr:SEC7-like protein [Cutaneotrichosporon oleaginosum]KLT43101.1 SEC7-like protein [Cutaneotrichosporon oleaginosum]